MRSPAIPLARAGFCPRSVERAALDYEVASSNTNATYSYEYRADGIRTRKEGVGTAPAGRSQEPPGGYEFRSRCGRGKAASSRRTPK
jgi:hypothetical protein